MSKLLLLHPGKWGRGMTPIWAASHYSYLKSKGHQCKYVDISFCSDWAVDENKYNTHNQQYKESSYNASDFYTQTPHAEIIQRAIDEFKPEIIFWSAYSSHIHGEGEYASLENGYTALQDVDVKGALCIVSGLRVTAAPEEVFKRFSRIDLVIRGDSEEALAEIASIPIKHLTGENSILPAGCESRESSRGSNSPRPITETLNHLAPYDYSIFTESALYRPYNGKVYKAIDYELSRGCIYSCGYCVETIMQKYYGFTATNARGALVNSSGYVRAKSAERIFNELKYVNKTMGVKYIRCQDTNFLTIPKHILASLADMLEGSDLDLFLYIETRPDGINKDSVELLKQLHVDGVGMGIELGSESIREEKLNRFCDKKVIEKVFNLLRSNGIKRTAYNIIGFPGESESSILETIEFNRVIQPDNVTVAFYSPYLGTPLGNSSYDTGLIDSDTYGLDPQLHSLCTDQAIDKDILNYYKENFVSLVNR